MADPPTHAINGTVKAIVDRIVAVADPTRVVLFGSAAHGERKKHGDYDVLVVVRGPAHRRQLARRIYRALRDVVAPVDIVVVTEDDVERYSANPYSIIHPALRDGVLLYGG